MIHITLQNLSKKWDFLTFLNLAAKRFILNKPKRKKHHNWNNFIKSKIQSLFNLKDKFLSAKNWKEPKNNFQKKHHNFKKLSNPMKFLIMKEPNSRYCWLEKIRKLNKKKEKHYKISKDCNKFKNFPIYHKVRVKSKKMRTKSQWLNFHNTESYTIKNQLKFRNLLLWLHYLINIQSVYTIDFNFQTKMLLGDKNASNFTLKIKSCLVNWKKLIAH